MSGVWGFRSSGGLRSFFWFKGFRVFWVGDFGFHGVWQVALGGSLCLYGIASGFVGLFCLYGGLRVKGSKSKV